MKTFYKPARNLRIKNIRVCATCALLVLENGMIYCHRENGINEDVGDMLHWIKVCDLWVFKADRLTKLQEVI